LLKLENETGILDINYYKDYQERVNRIRIDFLTFLLEQKKNNKKVIAYGAAAKGNTFLNYAGIKGNDLIHFVVDASDHKVNKFLPGSHIPIVDETQIKEYKPDYIIILPWNIKQEIMGQLSYISEWEGKFITFIPEKKIYDLSYQL
jgi:FlaA1/EpsC-like NDP-sugar epimerase